MKKHSGLWRELTLLELIIAIGLLSVFTAFDLQLFAAAHRLSRESETLCHAVAAAQESAENFRAGQAQEQYFDADWQPVDKSGAVYIVAERISLNGKIMSNFISISDSCGSELFSLVVKSSSEATS